MMTLPSPSKDVSSVPVGEVTGQGDVSIAGKPAFDAGPADDLAVPLRWPRPRRVSAPDVKFAVLKLPSPLNVVSSVPSRVVERRGGLLVGGARYMPPAATIFPSAWRATAFAPSKLFTDENVGPDLAVAAGGGVQRSVGVVSGHREPRVRPSAPEVPATTICRPPGCRRPGGVVGVRREAGGHLAVAAEAGIERPVRVVAGQAELAAGTPGSPRDHDLPVSLDGYSVGEVIPARKVRGCLAVATEGWVRTSGSGEGESGQRRAESAAQCEDENSLAPMENP